MKIHFIGIGGIGVSALARYFLVKGANVSGSDLASSEITDALAKSGAKIFIGPHSPENLANNLDIVIYSPAVRSDNPELQKARELRVQSSEFKIQSYPEALGELTKQYFTIAVSGAHGKSTTTAMISLVLEKAGLDPTVIIGTKLKEFQNSNCRVGEGKYLVIEADEWNASFLNYWPKIIVLTNIEREHLDYYRDLDHILKTFGEYVGHLPKDGVLIANGDDENINKIINYQLSIKKFSIKQKEAEELKKNLKVPGQHNIYNALATLAVARELGISDDISFDALSKYQGAWRRFEVSEKEISGKKITIVNDYGHHPTEVLATLKAGREKYPDRKIWCVFQPHQYQRTFFLLDDFVKVFSEVLKKTEDRKILDNLVLTDIYDVAGREREDVKKKVNSKMLCDKIGLPSAIYLPRGEMADYLKNNLIDGDVLIIMGAGSIYDLQKEL
jgi:UDP-N-acetylmuramate--alanine ligase